MTSSSRRPRPIHRTLRSGPSVIAVLSLLLSAPALAETKITLKKTFISKVRDQATISATFSVDHVGKVKTPSPSKPSNDGDIHCSGRAPEIGLPAVAEIMNAKTQPEAAAKLKAAEGGGQPVTIVGAWRVWCEHGGGDDQVQDAATSPAADTNPDHVFEIHPIASVDGSSTVSGFLPIPGYQTKDALTAFTAYSHTRCQLRQTEDSDKDTVTITTTNIGYNYVEYVLELNETPKPTTTGDGALAFAKVRDLSGELIHRRVRMVFVKDSPPFKTAKAKKAGTRLHVVGVPRIDLTLVNWRIEHSAGRPEVLDWNLPFEMIVVGVYDDSGNLEPNE